jgi:hypothetical protein
MSEPGEIKTEQLSISNPVATAYKALREFGFTTVFAIAALIGGFYAGLGYVKELKADADKQAVIVKKLDTIKKALKDKGCKVVEADPEEE